MFFFLQADINRVQRLDKMQGYFCILSNASKLKYSIEVQFFSHLSFLV
jgi:hypothetical protein